MLKKRIVPFILLFSLGAAVFFLPIREHDAMRLRYFIGLWFLAEAAFLFAQGENRLTPLYQLVWRYSQLRDKVVSGIALAAFFTTLYLSVWLLTENSFIWPVKLALAIATVLISWLVYYGLCLLLGTRELRENVTPKILWRRFHK